MAILNVKIEVDENGVAKLYGAGAAVGDINTQLGSLNSTATIATHIFEGFVGVLGARQMYRWAQDCVLANQAQKQADESLRQYTQTTGRYSQAYLSSLDMQARKLQDLLHIEREDIELGMGKLQIYGKISNDMMPRVIKDMLDLSRATGSVETAATLLGKASEGNLGQLARYGIVINKAIYESKGFVGILEEMEKRVGSQAEAWARGSGQWAGLSISANEAKKSFGALFDELADGSGVVKLLTEGLNALSVAMRSFGPDSKTESYAQGVDLNSLNSKLVSARSDLQIIQSQYSSQQKTGGPMFFGVTKADVIEAKANIRIISDEITASLTSMASKPSLAETILKQTTGMGGVITGGESDEDKSAFDKIEKLNEDITKKIKELSSSQYEYKKFLIDKEFEDQKEQHANIEKATRLHALALEKLDKDFLAKRDEWRKLYSEQATGRAALTSAPGEYVASSDLSKMYPTDNLDALIGSTKQSWAYFNTTLKEFNNAQQREAEESYKYFSDLQIKQAEESRKIWDDAALSLESSFMGAFDNIHKDGLDAFKDLGKNITDILIHAINRQVLTKPLESLTQGITGLFSDTTRLGPIDPISGLPTIVGSKGALAGAAPYMAAGAMGYGMYQQQQAGQLSPMSGAFQGGMGGATAGFMIGGPVGAGVGAVAGAASGIIMGALSSAKDELTLEDIINEQVFTDARQGFSSAIGQGFMDALSSGEYQSFKDSLNAGISETITAGLKSVFMSQVMNLVMPLFQPMFQKIADMQYQADYKGSTSHLVQMVDRSILNTKKAMWSTMHGGEELPESEYPTWGKATTPADVAALTPGEAEINTLMDQIEPIFTGFSDSILLIIDALGLNTAATQSNTDAIIGPVESFLRDLTTGSMASVVSAEGMQAAYDKALAAAIANPSSFSDFAGFAKSDYLPFMQNYGGDYSNVVGSTVGDVNALPWYNQGKSATPTAQEIGVEVAKALAANPTASGEIVIHVHLNGREIATEVVQEIVNSPELVSQI